MVCKQNKNSNVGARIAAILFTFHPIHVEAVASIVGRADSLSGLFYCAALFAYTLGVRMSQIQPRAVFTILILSKRIYNCDVYCDVWFNELFYPCSLLNNSCRSGASLRRSRHIVKRDWLHSARSLHSDRCRRAAQMHHSTQ